LVERRVKVKVCLVGENAVGKTSLIRKFVLDIFDDRYITTIGTKITKKTLTFEKGKDSVLMDMMIWDIMGQSSFRSLLQDAYFYGAHGVLAVADCTRSGTLTALHEWLDSTKQVVGEVPVVFLANKSDLKDKIQIDKKLLDSETKKHGGRAMFSSAKTGENVADAFQMLGRTILESKFPELI
jgi:small GTP-binding protein